MSGNDQVQVSKTKEEEASHPSWTPLATFCPNTKDLIIQEAGLNVIKTEMDLRKATAGAFLSVIGEDVGGDNVVRRLVQAWVTGPLQGPLDIQHTPEPDLDHHINNGVNMALEAVPIPAESVLVLSLASTHGYRQKVAIFLLRISPGSADPSVYTKLADFCLLLSSRTIVPVIGSNEQQSEVYNHQLSVIPRCNAKLLQLHFMLIDPSPSSTTSTSKVLSVQEFLDMINKNKISLTYEQFSRIRRSWKQFSNLRQYSEHSEFFGLCAPNMGEVWKYFRSTLELDDIQKENFSKPWPLLLENIARVSQLVNDDTTLKSETVQDTASSISEDTQIFSVSNQIRDDYMLLLHCLKSGWIQSVFTDDSIMDYEFSIFKQRFANEFASKMNDEPYRSHLEKVLVSAFQNEFQVFKTEYWKMLSEYSKRENLIEVNLRRLEEEFRLNWYQGGVDEFFNQISAKYLTLISAFDASAEDHLVATHVQLLVAKRYAEHEKDIRNAMKTLYRILRSLRKSFDKHLEEPLINWMPSKPEIPDISASNPRDAWCFKNLLENCIGASYQSMLSFEQEMNSERQVVPWIDISNMSNVKPPL